MFGLFAVALLVFFLRIVVKYFRSPSYFGSCLNVGVLFTLAHIMPRASLQAALVSQGLLIYCLLIFFLWVWNSRTT